TACWLNPPPQVRPLALNDSTPRLTHDFDLTLTGPDGTTFFPWTLDAQNPSAPAFRAPNRRDNVEQILLESAPLSGYYLLTVAAPQRMPRGAQAVAVVWQSFEPPTCPVVEVFQPDYATLCVEGVCTTFVADGCYPVPVGEGCEDLCFKLTVPDAPTLSIYPVPAREIVEVEAFWNGPVPNPVLELTDAAGKTLSVIPMESAPGPKHLRISVQDLASGVYWLRIRNAGLQKKLVVVR
ncbi:MAG: T9SS type A sorting domain-containing protein, partial [Bacteroidia bacterium]|nr:T9SS type A sorting domain-containing protein [Bacteroidia bacterium]